MALALGEIRNLLIDMDGVLYRGLMPLPGACDLMDFVERRGVRYLMVTNNSSLTQARFSERLLRMRMAVPERLIMTSAVATAEYLSRQASPGTRVNVIGENGLIEALRRRGFVLAGRDADYVVAGWDKGFSWEKLKTACLAIRDGATFIGTNPDKTYPTERDIIPGAGSMQAAVVASTDVEPLIVGKPETIIIEQCLEVLGAKASETAILGDRLDTDILGGQNAGISTLMVLTGISTEEEALSGDVPPDLIIRDLPELIRLWEYALGK